MHQHTKSSTGLSRRWYFPSHSKGVPKPNGMLWKGMSMDVPLTLATVVCFVDSFVYES